MKINPVAHRVVVVPITLEEEVSLPEGLAALDFKVKSGMEKNDTRYMKESLDEGTVQSIGWMAWKHRDYGWPSEDWKPWCKVGDHVLFGKHAGKLEIDPKTNEEFMILNDEDILAVIEE